MVEGWGKGFYPAMVRRILRRPVSDTPAMDWTVIAAPLASAGADEGEERAPAALLRAGAAAAARAAATVELEIGVSSSLRDPDSGVIGVGDVRRATATLAGAVGAALDTGRCALVLGGDCAIVPGITAAAVERLPDVALLFLDGHPDACDGQTSPTGEAADMDLAVLTGLGPPALAPGDRPGAIVAPERIALIGFRGDAGAAVTLPDGRRVTEVSLLHPGVHRMDAATLGDLGPEATVDRALAAIRPDAGPVWLHLDVDVHDADAMPAVSYPETGGPGIAVITAMLRRIARTTTLAGAHVTCFNPVLDPDGSAAVTVVVLIRSFAGR